MGEHQLAGLLSSCMQTQSPKRLRTSGACAPARKGWAHRGSPCTSRAQVSTVSSPASCARVETSHAEMDEVGSQSTEASFLTRVLQVRLVSTQATVVCQWQMQGQTPMEASSLFALVRHLTWMASTWSLEHALRVMMS